MRGASFGFHAMPGAAFGCLIVMPALLVACCLSGCSTGEIGTYQAGGRNVEASRYGREKGQPPFSDRADFIGTLRGSWLKIGRAYGERSGESARIVSDKWWAEVCEMYGRMETVRALELYEAAISCFDPGLVELMHGIAEGAGPWLSESPYADPKHELHATNYQRVLAVNVYDEWVIMHPRTFPDGTGTSSGAVTEPPVLPHMTGCSAFAARGKATSHGEVITAHNRHSPYDPRCYEQAFILAPDGGCACWVLSNSPQVAGNQVVNVHGVSLVLLAGGMSNPRSLGYEGGPYTVEAFGVPWFHLFVWVGTHARSAEEAIEMLTRGTEAYRRHSGRESLLRAGGWIFLVTDATSMAVVEASSDRYAVRYAGDETLFSGPDWTDGDFIVATNHYMCDFSYDAHNRRTDVPMTIFNEGCFRDPKTHEVTKLTESGVRFWTLMWDINRFHGRLDRLAAQQILNGTYGRDKDTGERIEAAQDDKGEWRLYGSVECCTAGFVSMWAGSCDGKVAVVDSNDVSVSWTLGNPIHWQGAWDRWTIRRAAKTQSRYEEGCVWGARYFLSESNVLHWLTLAL
jgi:hypothetical protein